jgi:hypothetical protein
MKRNWLAEKVLGMNGESSTKGMRSAGKRASLPMIGVQQEHPQQTNGFATGVARPSGGAAQRGAK